MASTAMRFKAGDPVVDGCTVESDQLRIRIFIRANNLLPVSATSPGAIASPGHSVPSSLDHVGRNLP